MAKSEKSPSNARRYSGVLIHRSNAAYSFLIDYENEMFTFAGSPVLATQAPPSLKSLNAKGTTSDPGGKARVGG